MKKYHVIVIGAALAALAGCSSTAPTKETTEPPASAAPVPVASSSLDAATMDATSAYLTALGNVDGALVANAQTAIEKGQLSCIDIEERRSAADQEKNVASRFAVDAGQAKKILAVAKESLCLN
jgi:hypothetical protein